MGSYLLTTVLLFSLLGCGLSTLVEYPYRTHVFDYPGKHGFEYPRKPGFDYPREPREPTPTEEAVYPDLMREEDELTTTLGENPVVCEVCQFVVSDLQSMLGNDSKEIVAFLDSLCADLPAPYAATCKQYVDGWTPYIIDFLENSTPAEICAELTLCTAQEPDVESRLGMNPFGRFVKFFHEVFRTKVDKVMMRQALGNDYLCEACDDIVEAVRKELTDDHVLDQLTALLEEVCNLTPEAKECDQFVKQVSAEVTALVKQYLNNETCAMIGLCPGFGVDRLEQFSGFFDDFDTDFLDRFRPRPRPRPETEPAPRGHPYREHDRNGSRGWPHPGHHDHHGHKNHSGDRHNHTSSRPHRPHMPHFNPFRRDHPHHGHGPVDRPLPDISRWWSPGARRPFWPRPSHWGSRTRPTRPLDPMIPLKPNKTSKPMPEPEAPRPTLPFVPVAKVGNIDPRKPYAPKKPFIPRLPEDIPVPRVDLGGLATPNRDNRRPRPQFPGKHHRLGEMKGNRRKQRSVVINSINTGDLDNGYEYNLESDHESEMQMNWQCDSCKYGVDLVQSFLLERAVSFQDELVRVAKRICYRLPAATVAECRTEVASVLNGLVVEAINNYITPDKVCPFLKLC